MLGWIASPFKQFGPTNNSTPPPQPTLAITNNANGTATATITGGDSGASNPVMVAPLPTSLANVTWSTGCTIAGNSSGTITLANGLYLAQVQASEGGLYSLLSNTVAFQVTGGTYTALSQTPAGNYPVGLVGVAWLIASSSHFQTLVGAADALHALEFVKFEADDTEESGSTRPRAIVYPAPEGFSERRVALNEFRPFMRFWVSIEAVPPGGILLETPRETRLKDEHVWFDTLWQAILDDCKATEGKGTGYVSGQSQVSCSEIRLLDGPTSAPLEVRGEGQNGEIATYFYGVTFEFLIHG